MGGHREIAEPLYVLADVLRGFEAILYSVGPPAPGAATAVDRKEQGRGLGAALLKNAFYRIAFELLIVGAKAVLVHPIDSEAGHFMSGSTLTSSLSAPSI